MFVLLVFYVSDMELRNSSGSIHFSSYVMVYNMRAKSGLVCPFVPTLGDSDMLKARSYFYMPKYLVAHCGQ